MTYGLNKLGIIKNNAKEIFLYILILLLILYVYLWVSVCVCVSVCVYLCVYLFANQTSKIINKQLFFTINQEEQQI